MSISGILKSNDEIKDRDTKFVVNQFVLNITLIFDHRFILHWEWALMIGE